jgi:hypothetical protein
MREKPYQVINILTNETVDWCTYDEYVAKYVGKSGFDVSYRPGRKKKVKK